MPEQPFDDFDLGGVEEEYNEDENLSIQDLEMEDTNSVQEIFERYATSKPTDNPHVGVIVFDPTKLGPDIEQPGDQDIPF